MTTSFKAVFVSVRPPKTTGDAVSKIDQDPSKQAAITQQLKSDDWGLAGKMAQWVKGSCQQARQLEMDPESHTVAITDSRSMSYRVTYTDR